MTHKINNVHFIKLLGQFIKFHRLRKNVSQDELAFKCSITQSSLSNIERGATSTKIHNLVNIFNTLEISIKDFVTFLDKQTHENSSIK